MGEKKCEVSQNESTPLPSNCNEVISRYELLQELHRRDQDSEEIIETVKDMAAKGTIKGSVILPSSDLSKPEIKTALNSVYGFPPVAKPIVVAVDIDPMDENGVSMSPNSTRFLATLESANCDRLGLMADYVIDIGEKRVVLHRDGTKITGVSIHCVDR